MFISWFNNIYSSLYKFRLFKGYRFCTHCDSSIVTPVHHCWPQLFLLLGSSTENFVVDMCIHICVYYARGLREEYTKQEQYGFYIIKTKVEDKCIYLLLENKTKTCNHFFCEGPCKSLLQALFHAQPGHENTMSFSTQQILHWGLLHRCMGAQEPCKELRGWFKKKHHTCYIIFLVSPAG